MTNHAPETPYNKVNVVDAEGFLINFGRSPSDGTTPTARTPNYSVATTSGTIAQGAFSIAIANIGVSAGTLAGAEFPVGASINFEAPPGDFLAAIAYDATDTKFIIGDVR